jgi:hypothetical protein
VASKVKLIPNKSAILHHLSYPLIYIFNPPITPGKYLFHLKLENGLSFEINLLLGKSENEITDTTGIISPIYPLKVGNKWTYAQKILYKDGTVMDYGTFSMSIIWEVLIDGEKWFWLSYSNGYWYFITSRQDGIYKYLYSLKTAQLMYKYPAALSEQYLSGEEIPDDFGNLSLLTYKMSVDSLNEMINVPSGNYNCIKYHTPSYWKPVGSIVYDTGDEDNFLSSVGLVKNIVYPNKNGDAGYIMELVSTNVK